MEEGSYNKSYNLTFCSEIEVNTCVLGISVVRLLTF